MRVYYHPASTTSRTIMLFAAETGMEVELKLVDIMSGEQYQPDYGGINPSRLVPVLEDGDFRLTESSAILKYLAEKAGSPTYPKDLRERARVNEVMDWVNTQLCRELAYGLVYPQIVPTHKRPSDELQRGTLTWGKERAQQWMKVLDQDLIGQKKKYLCGDSITIADYFASAFVSLAEFIRCDFTAYPNLSRWYAAMKALPSWNKVNEAFYGWAGSTKAARFETF